jgi:RHS repeat-associated protein
VRTESGTLSTSFLFTGEQFDVASDLYYLRARYYDPSIGRFLTRDPFRGWVASPETHNPYAYPLDNPTNLIDPYGYWGLKDAWKGAKNIGGTIGGGIEAGARWVGEDYHWATVGAAAAGTAFAVGVVLLTSPVSLPLGGAILTTALLSGGLGVGVPLTILSVAHSGKECAADDTGACVSAGVGGISAPLGFAPGRVVPVGFEWLPVLTDIIVSAVGSGEGHPDEGASPPKE